MGAQPQWEPRHALTTGLILTPAHRSGHHDRNSCTDRNHTQTSAAIQCLHYKISLFPPVLGLWESYRQQTPHSTKEGCNSSHPLPPKPVRYTLQVKRRRHKDCTNCDPFPPPFKNSVGLSPVLDPQDHPALHIFDTCCTHAHFTVHVQRVTALFQMGLLALFCHERCIRVKTRWLYFAVNPDYQRVSRQGRIQGFTLHCLVWQIHSKWTQKCYCLQKLTWIATSDISDKRLCWDKCKGPHLACQFTWHTKEPRRSAASGEHAPSSTALQNTKCHVPRLYLHCNLTELLCATSRVTDPAASGTLGYQREAAALRCKCARYRLHYGEAPGLSQARAMHSMSMANCSQADLAQQRYWQSHTSQITILAAAWQRAARTTTVLRPDHPSIEMKELNCLPNNTEQS